MVRMTMQPEPARDTVGRFATQEHTEPEMGLAEQYLEDSGDGVNFDVHEFYDVKNADAFDAWSADHRAEDAATAGEGYFTPEGVYQPTPEEEAAFESWLAEREPQGIDEYFAGPEPVFTAVADYDATPPF